MGRQLCQMNDMVEVARIELAASPDIFRCSTPAPQHLQLDRAKYISDRKKLTLFQIVSATTSGDDCDDEQFSHYSGLLLYKFQHDSSGELFICDQQPHLPVSLKQVNQMELKLCIKFKEYFNSKNPGKLAALFVKDTKIKVPACHAVPDTCFAALYETVAKIRKIERWFRNEDTGRQVVLMKVQRKSRTSRASKRACLAVCEFRFAFDYVEDRTRVKSLYFCHS